MKKPLSDISLTTAMQTLTAITGFLMPSFLCMAQESEAPDTGSCALPNDTIHAIMPLSDSEEESFFRGVIPPSPNAAALARYAEYPVSHTTGIPDISIPLYEIRMGGFTLPISVSYHASGCRVDDVLTYDDLGRVVSVKRGDTSKVGTVSYRYNLHGQTTSISGPGFSQSLHYTDGPGKPLYNGSVSAMSWTMGSDGTRREYRYTYNGYGWLTLAEYAEGETLSSHKDRYTERFLNFMPNGGIRRLQRHGLKSDGNYGKIDNLHISYDGNRITAVLEDAADVTTTGSMDYPGKQTEMEFGYNGWGALTRDESRGITNIVYDNFGNPIRISFSDGGYTKNVYSAGGAKLKTEHYTNLSRPVNAVTSAMDFAAEDDRP